MFFIQFVCQLANNIVSVERVRQYMQIESEGPAIIENSRPSPNWPDQGKVELQNLQVYTWGYVQYLNQHHEFESLLSELKIEILEDYNKLQ